MKPFSGLWGSISEKAGAVIQLVRGSIERQICFDNVCCVRYGRFMVRAAHHHHHRAHKRVGGGVWLS
jgi:hypothetical protein